MTVIDDGPSQCPPFTLDLVTQAEKTLGYKRPQAYVDALRENKRRRSGPWRIPHGSPDELGEQPSFFCRDLMGYWVHVNGIDGDTEEPVSHRAVGHHPDIGIVFSTEGHHRVHAGLQPMRGAWGAAKPSSM